LTEATDDRLVQEALGGGLQAFDQLMLRYQKLVCKVAMNYVKDRQSGLDVTQNVFLKAYKNLSHVKAEGMFKPWLLRITYNESINWIRKGKRDERHEDLDNYVEVSATEPDQENRIFEREDQGRVLEGLRKLNPKYRMAVALRYAEGLRVREIADVMGCSEGMVKSLLFRGVRQIKKNIARPA
jgi:RNA polymerase sigma-70 factor (ECF subfamily)